MLSLWLFAGAAGLVLGGTLALLRKHLRARGEAGETRGRSGEE